MVELRETGGHLSAPGTGTCNDHEGFISLNVLVSAVTLVAHDQFHVRGVALGVAVSEDRDIPPLQLVLEDKGCRLLFEARDHDTQNIDTPVPEVVDELERVGVVGDAEIRPDLLAFDVPGIDTKEHVRLVFKLLDKPHLDVGIIPRQDSRSVVIAEELPAELEVELAEAVDSFKDFTCLFFDIPFVIETLFFDHPSSPGLGIRVPSCTTIVKGFSEKKKGDLRDH